MPYRKERIPIHVKVSLLRCMYCHHEFLLLAPMRDEYEDVTNMIDQIIGYCFYCGKKQTFDEEDK